jgi:hypothetical protein
MTQQPVELASIGAPARVSAPAAAAGEGPEPSSARGDWGQSPSQAAPEPIAAIAVHELEAVQAAVYGILRYAISRAKINVGDALIDTTLPLLRKPPSALGPDEEAVLWKSYNALSVLVSPATSEGILIGEQIEAEQRSQATKAERAKWWPVAVAFKSQQRRLVMWLWLSVFVFILLQGYVICLSDVLADAEQHAAAFDTLTPQIDAIKAADPNADPNKPPLKSLLAQQEALELRIGATHDTLLSFILPWRPEDTDRGNAERQKARIANEQGARSMLRVLSYYLLPLVLGFLGAIAFIARRRLDGLAAHDSNLISARRVSMRLALGGLLGVASGIIMAPDQTELDAFNLPLVTLAFLMGYSVEFAFSAFDALIDRGRQAVRPDRAREPQA